MRTKSGSSTKPPNCILEVELTGRFVSHDQTRADVDGGCLLQIDEARREAEARQRGRDEAAALMD